MNSEEKMMKAWNKEYKEYKSNNCGFVFAMILITIIAIALGIIFSSCNHKVIANRVTYSMTPDALYFQEHYLDILDSLNKGLSITSGNFDSLNKIYRFSTATIIHVDSTMNVIRKDTGIYYLINTIKMKDGKPY